MPKRTGPKPREGLLFFLPKHTLPLEAILEDLERPAPSALAKALGVCPRTVSRWIASGQAPRPVLLALFYATRWGRADVHHQAEKDARAQAALAFHLQCELDKANALLAKLGHIGDFGSANDPARQVASRPPVPSVPGDGDAQPMRTTSGQVQQPTTTSQRRAAQAAKRLAKRASGPPRPFDFLRFG